MSVQSGHWPGRIRHGVAWIVERALTFLPLPGLRARLLRWGGATIGLNVRLHEIRLFNLANGFSNLTVGDDVFIGPGTRIDLAAPVHIGTGTVLSPECLLLSHTDTGERHASPMTTRIRTQYSGVHIGEHCYLGARTTVLPGVRIDNRVAVAAGAVITRDVGADRLMAGIPARMLKRYD